MDDHLGKEMQFTYDQIFTHEMNNDEIYGKSFGPLIDGMMNGYNSTCFAYGMTGAGKTHTMFGDLYETGKCERGLCVMAVHN